MEKSNDSVLLVGRILLSIIFVMAGIDKLIKFGGTVEDITSVGVPLATVAAVGAIVVEIAGGLSVALGSRTRLGSGLLVLFLIPATLLFHNPAVASDQLIPFMKNLAIMGGLLVLFSSGPGRWALQSD